MPRTSKLPDETLQATVTVEAIFGSDVQKSVGMRVLTQFLEAWKQNVENAHKKNRITITQ